VLLVVVVVPVPVPVVATFEDPALQPASAKTTHTGKSILKFINLASLSAYVQGWISALL
jgi:hypothetical protein